MNKAITDGVLLMPPAFANGLDVWSSGDGTPGSDTYENASNAAFVPADQDFGGCLELQKTSGTTRVRYMGQTPLLPGCYLRITARIKAIAGNLPSVRIAGYAARSNGSAVGGVDTTADVVTLTSYGSVVEVSAIVGAGNRSGVDLVWGAEPVYGHFGLDLTGPNGGVVRIDDLVIEDISSVFLSDLVSVVDVRDYGAVGDGTTDDSAAFDAADAAANGRTVLVSEGTFRLNSDVAFNNSVRFEGTVSMPDTAMLLIRKNYSLPTYIDAFGDEVLGFKKAFQALLNNSDHDSLDMEGRRIALTEPIDMQAAVPNRTTFATRRVVKNGQIEAVGDDWSTVVATSQATYSASNSRKLTNVTNVANVPVGALVQANGVGREIYVRSKNVGAQEIELNAPLYDAEGTQTYTFRRFDYLLDFSGFASLSLFIMSDIEFQCNSKCSAVLLSPGGPVKEFQDCYFSRPKDRGITSIGEGCQGMLINRCQFLSAEEPLDVADRVSIGMNVNANDVKLKDCRATRFRHWAVMDGQNHLISGNHFFQGDNVPSGVRTAGIILQENFSASMITGNYIDNCFIEWTNERDPTPAFSGGFSFSALTISDNVYLSGDVAPWFTYIVVKPFAAGHFLNGVTITGNRFRSINGSIVRAESVDTSFADLDHSRNKDVCFTGNSYHNVQEQAHNPLHIEYTQNSNAQTWTIDTNNQLPFEAYCRSVDAVVAIGDIRNSSNAKQFQAPVARGRAGLNDDQFTLEWGTSVRGPIRATVRMDG
ncbi:glycosyl hydrolase family 28-related protein [uncultured Tateyamaria sp.]|uniref:glycosyl hydrolase family 28-related protein n=1 Tax=Tateyamaria sp. 1078 TaxID=3417464 RepID=UPI002608D93A|nr:glycosyl hydrolase family 28-related protein [uncultured Tateyamaria sp.]